MRNRVVARALLAGASLLPLQSQGAAAAAARPIYKVLSHGDVVTRAHGGGAQSLKMWSGSWTYNGVTYPFTMLGADPSKSNRTTTIKAFIIPIRMIYSKTVYGKDARTFDPDKDKWNGMPITQALVNSPLFARMDWKWGSTDMGTTQYADAFQRGSFWGSVSTNTNYHVILAPKILREVSLRPTLAEGGAVIRNPFGKGKIGEMDFAAFDEDLQTFIRKFSQVNPGTLAVFLTDNIYLASGGCCIGGYYAVEHPQNTQIYQSCAYSTFVTSPGAFAQDISGFSHDIAYLYDNPLASTTPTPCGDGLDVVGPFGGKADYGDFDVRLQQHHRIRRPRHSSNISERRRISRPTTGWTISTSKARCARTARSRTILVHRCRSRGRPPGTKMARSPVHLGNRLAFPGMLVA